MPSFRSSGWLPCSTHVAAVLPGVEAAGAEVGPLRHVEIGDRVRGERPVVCGMGWGEPPGAKAVEQIVRSVEGAHPAAAGDEDDSPALDRGGLDTIALGAELRHVGSSDLQAGRQRAADGVRRRAAEEDEVAGRRLIIVNDGIGSGGAIDSRSSTAQSCAQLDGGEALGAGSVVARVGVEPVDLRLPGRRGFDGGEWPRVDDDRGARPGQRGHGERRGDQCAELHIVHPPICERGGRRRLLPLRRNHLLSSRCSPTFSRPDAPPSSLVPMLPHLLSSRCSSVGTQAATLQRHEAG